MACNTCRRRILSAVYHCRFPRLAGKQIRNHLKKWVYTSFDVMRPSAIRNDARLVIEIRNIGLHLYIYLTSCCVTKDAFPNWRLFHLNNMYCIYRQYKAIDELDELVVLNVLWCCCWNPVNSRWPSQLTRSVRSPVKSNRNNKRIIKYWSSYTPITAWWWDDAIV